jgi:cytidylate kinase
MYESSTIAHLVEEQWQKWLQLTRETSPADEPGKPLPTVAISRERGSGGGIVARRVAERLQFVLFDSEIVDHVARAASVDRLAVAQMDEQSQHNIREWTERVIHRRAFSPQSYMEHLTRTILTAGEKGRAVIVGRGAHLILPVGRCLRARIVAPLELRIQRVAAGSGIPLKEAATLIAQTDRQRSQFIRENFQQSDSNPLLHDLVINTSELTLEAAADLILSAVAARFPQIAKWNGSAASPILKQKAAV